MKSRILILCVILLNISCYKNTALPNIGGIPLQWGVDRRQEQKIRKSYLRTFHSDSLGKNGVKWLLACDIVLSDPLLFSDTNKILLTIGRPDRIKPIQKSRNTLGNDNQVEIWYYYLQPRHKIRRATLHIMVRRDGTISSMKILRFLG